MQRESNCCTSIPPCTLYPSEATLDTTRHRSRPLPIQGTHALINAIASIYVKQPSAFLRRVFPYAAPEASELAVKF